MWQPLRDKKPFLRTICGMDFTALTLFSISVITAPGNNVNVGNIWAFSATLYFLYDKIQRKYVK